MPCIACTIVHTFIHCLHRKKELSHFTCKTYCLFYSCEHSGKTKLYITWMQPLRAHRSAVWLWRKWKDVFLERRRKCGSVCVCECVSVLIVCWCVHVNGTFCMQHPQGALESRSFILWCAPFKVFYGKPSLTSNAAAKKLTTKKKISWGE